MNGDQDKLNETMRRHLEFMKFLWLFFRMTCGTAMVIGGYVYMLQTKGHFGDVPIVVGVVWMSKLIRE